MEIVIGGKSKHDDNHIFIGLLILNLIKSNIIIKIEKKECDFKFICNGDVVKCPKQMIQIIENEYKDTIERSMDIETLINRSNIISIETNFTKLCHELNTIEEQLNFRTYLGDTKVSFEDIFYWSSLFCNHKAMSVVKSNNYKNILRWKNFLSEFENFDKVREIIKHTEKEDNIEENKKQTHKASFEIELDDAKEGCVVTRFPPEPSGYLHIGHAKAAILNEYFASKYKGKMIIRFDDTNPSKEKDEFELSILEDLEFLGIKGTFISHSSDYFERIYNYAIELIKQGKAYCDDTSVEIMRNERMVGTASSRRERLIDENMSIFVNEMKNGTEIGLKNCLRGKVDYKSLNKCMRDPVFYRCNLTPHHKLGDEWKIYPTYDFATPIVDSIEGVTHALRTNEYRDRNEQYNWVLNVLNLKKIHIWDFGRLNFVRTLLSKRKLQWFVDNGVVDSWEDPRFPTIRGLRKRGLTLEGLRNFILSQGPSKNIINLDWSILWALNKKVIDPIVPRFTAIESEKSILINLLNGPSRIYSEFKPKHKKNPDLGLKKVFFSNQILIESFDANDLSENEEITLMDWGNIIIKKIVNKNNTISHIDADLHLEGDFKKTKKKITWIANTEEKINVDLVDFDHLITKDKLTENDDFKNYITPNSEFHYNAFSEKSLCSLKAGTIIQFERKGFYIINQSYQKGKKIILFTVPDGKKTKSK